MLDGRCPSCKRMLTAGGPRNGESGPEASSTDATSPDPGAVRPGENTPGGRDVCRNRDVGGKSRNSAVKRGIVAGLWVGFVADLAAFVAPMPGSRQCVMEFLHDSAMALLNTHWGTVPESAESAVGVALLLLICCVAPAAGGFLGGVSARIFAPNRRRQEQAEASALGSEEGQAQAAARAVGKVYSSEKYGFTVGYPQAWEVVRRDETEGQWTCAVGIAGPVAPGGRTGLMLQLGPITDHGSVASYLERAKSDLKSLFRSFSVVRCRERTLSGCEAAWLEYRYQGDSGPRSELNVTLFAGKTLQVPIQFIFECPRNEYSASLPLFGSIIESFRISPGGLRLPHVELRGTGQCGRCGAKLPGSVPALTVMDPKIGDLIGICRSCKYPSSDTTDGQTDRDGQGAGSCPHGHGPLRLWDGKSRCWTCGHSGKGTAGDPVTTGDTDDWAVCPVCGAKVKAKNLERHMAKVHDGGIGGQQSADSPVAAGRAAAAQVSPDECVDCGQCVDECPAGAISMADNGAVIDRGACTGCGQCVEACPVEAITMESLEARGAHDQAPADESGGQNPAAAVRAEAPQHMYECAACGYVYSPAAGDPESGVPPDTAFGNLGGGWVCPDCGAGKDDFEPVDEVVERSPAPAPAPQATLRQEQLANRLLSDRQGTREAALVEALQLSEQGNHLGLRALEHAIRTRNGNSACHLYEPGLAVRQSGELANAKETVLELAAQRAICRQAYDAGRAICMLGTLGLLDSPDDVRVLLGEIERAGGEGQLIEFQLVGTHTQAFAKLGKRERG